VSQEQHKVILVTFDFQEDYKIPHFRVTPQQMYFAHKQIVQVLGILNEGKKE
jgi:hypothetical protein